MCGHYRLSRRKQIIEEHFDAMSGEEDWTPRYNVAPTQPVLVIRQNPADPTRNLSQMRWGLITDTKTGSNTTTDGIVTGHGEKLQPVLYSLAVEAARRVTVAEARLSFPTSAGGFSQCTIPISEESRNQGLEVLRIIDNAIATGFLPPAPREEGCKYCDFRPVCGPYEQRRAAKKDPNPLEDLIRLRGMA